MDFESSMGQLNAHLDNIGWGKFQNYVFFVCGSAWINDMLWIVNMGLILDDASKYWDIKNSEKGMIASMFLIGALLGCYVWGYLSDRFGRMFSFKKTVLLASLSSLCLATSTDPGFFILFEVLVGFAIGGELALGGTVYSEFCPPKRSWTLTLLAANWCLGGAISGLIAICISLSGMTVISMWRAQAIISGLLMFVFYLIRLKMPETPKYLLFAEHLHQAEDCLQYIIEFNGGDPLGIYQPTIEGKGEKVSTRDSEPLVTHDKDSLMRMLFSSKYMKATSLFTIIYFFGIGSCIALIEFMPVLLENSGDASFETELYKYETITLQQIAAVPSILISAKLVDTPMGRRWTVALPFFVSGIFAYVFLYAQSYYTVSAK